jgi:RloB-like protein
MARSSNSYRRAPARFRAQPTILVICEDEKSGRHYLQDASQFFRADVHFEFTHCGHTDPLGIVRAALKRAPRFDSVYCVIDRDSHHHFAEAINLADKSEKVTVIVSYPCFEYWLLLHFNESRKPYTAAGNKSAADVLIDD